MQIVKAPDTVTTRHIYKKAQAVEDNTHAYIIAAAELDATDADIQLKKKPETKNPEDAEEFVKQVKITVDKFAEVIHSYEPYKIKDTYTDFVTRYYDLLADIEEYFKDASITDVLECVDVLMTPLVRCSEWRQNVINKTTNFVKTPESA